jgi:hypothetical protein
VTPGDSLLRGENAQKQRILRQIVASRQPELLPLIEAIGTTPLGEDDRELLREAVASELVDTGLTVDDEVTPHGQVLEDLIDWLGTR